MVPQIWKLFELLSGVRLHNLFVYWEVHILECHKKQKMISFVILLSSGGHYIFQETGEKSVETVEVSYVILLFNTLRFVLTSKKKQRMSVVMIYRLMFRQTAVTVIATGTHKYSYPLRAECRVTGWLRSRCTQLAALCNALESYLTWSISFCEYRVRGEGQGYDGALAGQVYRPSRRR